MKGKKFYVTLIGLFILGIVSVFFNRQQEEARALEFEGYEIATIEKRVDTLYNDKKTDIQEDISTELIELEQILLELNNKDLSNRSERRLKEMEENLLTAKVMHELQEDILEIFKENEVVRRNVSLKDVKELETSLLTFKERRVYFNRNNGCIDEAKVQINKIEEATKLVAELKNGDDINEDVKGKDIEELEKLVNQIKDENIKEDLLKKINTIRLALDDMEIEVELVLDEVEQELEETEELYSGDIKEVDNIEAAQNIEEVKTSTQDNTNQQNTNNLQSSTSNRISSSSQSNRQTSNSSTRQPSGTSGKQSASQSSATPKPAKTTPKPAQTPPQQMSNNPEVVETYKDEKVAGIPFETFVYEDSSLDAGTEIVYTEGSTGSLTEVYEVTVYDNGTSNTKVISRDRTEPVDRVITIGTKETE